MELLRVSNVSRVYSSRGSAQQCRALYNVSFNVEQGEFLAIMGPSGSGKSTLLNIIASLDKPTSGDVTLDGRSFSTIKDKEMCQFRREHLGFVFQDFNLLDNFSVKDNILLPLVLSNIPIADMEARLAPIAAQLGIAGLLNKYPYEVSGGEQQRAAVARAMITDPRIILADEPTGALDSRSSAALLNSFSQLNAAGKTILMVTHSAQAASFASRILFIRDGSVFSQIYRGDASSHEFLERIVANLSALPDGGAMLA